MSYRGLLLGISFLFAVGCGGTVTVGPLGASGGGGSAGTGATAGTGGWGGFTFDGGPPFDSGSGGLEDAQSDYQDPGCPDAAPPPPDTECDLFHEPSGCVAGTACYPYVDYPSAPCQQEVYGTMCAAPGSGRQGDPCDSQNCAAGFVCVITGQGTQCVQDCPLTGPDQCPDGLFCVPIDVKGYGGCF